MAATLTWLNSGLGTKTGTTVAAFITDMVSLMNTYSGNPAYLWQIASSSTAGNPHWIVYKRKAGSAGRILHVIWTSAPAGNNAAILDGAPTANRAYVAWFPNGNVDSPSNLLAASGTILGDDTGCVKVSAQSAVSTIYGASIQPFYFESNEAIWFGWQNPASTTTYCQAAGNLVVDGADVEYGATLSYGAASANSFGSSNTVMPWTINAQLAGASATAHLRTNYGSANRVYYHAMQPSGSWAASVVGPDDILTDTTTNRVWFVPVQLLGTTKGEGFVLKLRQVTWGPGTLGAFTAYNTTGPVVQARQFNAATAGGNGYPWLVNFRI